MHISEVCLDLKNEIPKSWIQKTANTLKSVLLFQNSDVSALQGCVQSWVCPRHFFFFYMLRLISSSSSNWFHSLAGIAGCVRLYHWSLNILWNTLLKLLYRSLSHTSVLLWSSGVADKMPPFLMSAAHVTAIPLEKGLPFWSSKKILNQLL